MGDVIAGSSARTAAPKRNRAPFWTRDRLPFIALTRSALQYFDGFIELIIHRVLGFCFLLRRVSCWRFLVVWSNRVVGRVGHENIGGDSRVLNGLTARRIILCNGEDQCAAVVQRNRLLDGTVAKSLIAYDVSARVLKNSCGHDFCRARRTAVHQYGKG